MWSLAMVNGAFPRPRPRRPASLERRRQQKRAAPATLGASLSPPHPNGRVALILGSGAVLKPWALTRRSADEERRAETLKGTGMLRALFALLAGLFSRKEDDFKTLLMADLGIER